jgi:hypothetical protein
VIAASEYAERRLWAISDKKENRITLPPPRLLVSYPGETGSVTVEVEGATEGRLDCSAPGQTVKLVMAGKRVAVVERATA